MEQTPNPPKVKGDYEGLCNRSACLSPEDVTWYNHSTRLYYCEVCALQLNFHNRFDAHKMFGHELCTQGKN